MEPSNIHPVPPFSEFYKILPHLHHWFKIELQTRLDWSEDLLYNCTTGRKRPPTELEKAIIVQLAQELQQKLAIISQQPITITSLFPLDLRNNNTL